MSAEEKMPASACPFCGYSGNIHIHKESTTNPKFFYYAAHCQRCGAEGPLGYTAQEACQCWQARMEPLEADSSENGNPFLERPEARASIGMGDARYWKENAQ